MKNNIDKKLCRNERMRNRLSRLYSDYFGGFGMSTAILDLMLSLENYILLKIKNNMKKKETTQENAVIASEEEQSTLYRCGNRLVTKEGGKRYAIEITRITENEITYDILVFKLPRWEKSGQQDVDNLEDFQKVPWELLS